MKLVIIEDEKPALEKLRKAVKAFSPAISIEAELSSVKESITWFHKNPVPDLILLDIELTDGLSLEIFKQCTITCPVIFTTAYDEYLQEAFEYNSIDYLLKPIKQEKLEQAMNKYQKLKNHFVSNYQSLADFLQRPSSKRKRFLVKRGIEFQSIRSEDIAYFFSEHKISFLVDRSANKFIMDLPLAELEGEVDKEEFFRVNRKYLVSMNAISKFRPYEKGKIMIELFPPVKEEVIISQETAPAFRQWMGK